MRLILETWWWHFFDCYDSYIWKVFSIISQRSICGPLSFVIYINNKATFCEHIFQYYRRHQRVHVWLKIQVPGHNNSMQKWDKIFEWFQLIYFRWTSRINNVCFIRTKVCWLCAKYSDQYNYCVWNRLHWISWNNGWSTFFNERTRRSYTMYDLIKLTWYTCNILSICLWYTFCTWLENTEAYRPVWLVAPLVCITGDSNISSSVYMFSFLLNYILYFIIALFNYNRVNQVEYMR